MNIFIGSLPFSLKESELRGYFEKYGEVSSVKIITDKYSGKSKGFGFIEMPDDDAAKDAIEGLNESEISGRKVVVNKAEEKETITGGVISAVATKVAAVAKDVEVINKEEVITKVTTKNSFY